jgi:hypothetical protein
VGAPSSSPEADEARTAASDKYDDLSSHVLGAADSRRLAAPQIGVASTQSADTSTRATGDRADDMQSWHGKETLWHLKEAVQSSAAAMLQQARQMVRSEAGQRLPRGLSAAAS